jgi:hypothetical protein
MKKETESTLKIIIFITLAVTIIAALITGAFVLGKMYPQYQIILDRRTEIISGDSGTGFEIEGDEIIPEKEKDTPGEKPKEEKPEEEPIEEDPIEEEDPENGDDEPEVPPVCSDSDNGEVYIIAGNCIDILGASHHDVCFDGNFGDMLTEFWCSNDESGMCSEMVQVCAPEGKCYMGRCIPNNQDHDGDGWTDLEEYEAGTDPNDADDFPEAACTDTDGGINYLQKGTCTDVEGASTDYCDVGGLVEYYCNDNDMCASNDNDPLICDEEYGENWYCSAGKCKEADPMSCEGNCYLDARSPGGFCGDIAEPEPWADCAGSQGEFGFYLANPMADMECINEELPFNSCCCDPGFH